MPAVTDARVQTTLRLPDQLYRELKVILDQHLVEFASLNDLAVAALDQFIRRLREQQIDAEFAQMADDPHYANESRILAGEFARSDWEALQVTEGKSADSATR